MAIFIFDVDGGMEVVYTEPHKTGPAARISGPGELVKQSQQLRDWRRFNIYPELFLWIQPAAYLQLGDLLTDGTVNGVFLEFPKCEINRRHQFTIWMDVYWQCTDAGMPLYYQTEPFDESKRNYLLPPAKELFRFYDKRRAKETEDLLREECLKPLVRVEPRLGLFGSKGYV